MIQLVHAAALHRTAEYKPSAFYFREALRSAYTREEAIAIGLQIVREIENLKAQMRAAGLTPTLRFILSTEAEAKGLTRPCDLAKHSDAASAIPSRAKSGAERIAFETLRL